jgi:protein-disulfide isomerase
MKNLPLLIATLVGTVLLVVVVAFFASGSSTPKPVDQALLVGQTKNVKGSADAKVTVVEFSDLQCPACKATQPIVDQLLQQDGEKIRFIYRHFPLTEVHKNAQQAALTAQVAASFGKFWEFHDMAFANQKEWADLSANDVKAKFLEYIEKLQIDKTEFQKRIDSQDVAQQITQDVADGTKAGVDATPTFYVNGQKTAAPQLISTVESLLNTTK